MPYFFVEGHCERNFISHACKGVRVRRIDLNGSSVSIIQIVIRIETIFRTMPACADPIVVIFDREKRSAPSTDIADEVRRELASRGIEAIVGVPDRSIETWMLYDSAVFPDSNGDYEGKMGATLLREAFGRYDKANDGPNILKRCRASELRQSASFRSFVEALAWLRCWWLEK